MIALLADSALRTLLVAGIAALVLGASRVRNPYALKSAWIAVLGVGLLMPLLLHWIPWRLGAAPMSAAVLPAISVAGAAASVSGTSRLVIDGLYAAVSLALLGRMALGIGRMWRVRRRAARLEQSWLGQNGLERSGAGRLDARVSASLACPVTFGSTVLLPPDCRDWSRAKQAAVLVHERSHVEQRDAYIHWLALLHAAVFWFNPLAWWLLRRLMALAEQTSDAAVLRQGGDRSEYASVLLEFARAGSRLRPVPQIAGGSSVARRIEQIVSGAPVHSRIPAWKRAALIGLTLPAAAIGASLWRSSLAQPTAAQASAALAGTAQESAAQPSAAQPGAAPASSSEPKVVSWRDLQGFYPRKAARAGIEGFVRVAVTLDGAGRPTGVAILSEQPAGYGFGSEASRAVAYGAFRFSNPTGLPASLVFNVKFALHR